MNDQAFRDALERQPLLGFCSMYPAPGIIERLGAHWDWCWIDAQHGQWDVHTVIDAVRACDLAGLYSMVRVPGQEAGVIGKILDTACNAIMVPMVDTPEQAQQVVRAACFAPQGKRSYGGRRPIDLHGRAYSHGDRPQPMVVCQIESPEALQQAEAIAAVDGVDALFFGPDDMAVAQGLPMDQPRAADTFDSAMQRIAAAASGQGKVAAGIFRTPEALQRGVAQGYRMLVGSADAYLLSVHSEQAAASLRESLESNATGPTEASGASLY